MRAATVVSRGLPALFLLPLPSLYTTSVYVQNLNHQLRKQCHATCAQGERMCSDCWHEEDGCVCETNAEQRACLAEDLKTACSRACRQKNLHWSKTYSMHQGCTCTTRSPSPYKRFVPLDTSSPSACQGYPLTIDAQGNFHPLFPPEETICSSSYTSRAP
jgi:hypothetical protein